MMLRKLRKALKNDREEGIDRDPEIIRVTERSRL